MTVYETRIYLEQPATISKKINALLLVKTETKAILTRCTANLESVENSSGGYRSRIEDTISKIIDLENQITAEIDTLVDKKAEILANIMRLPDNDSQTVLISRYINFKTVEQTAALMGYCSKSIKRKTQKAVEELSKIL